MNPGNPTELSMTDDAQTAGGQRETTTVVMERYATKLYRYLLRRLHIDQDAKDLLQTVFLRFWQNPQQELVRKPEAYLYQIASNVLTEFQLRQARSLLTYDSEATVSQAERLTDAELWSDELGDQFGLEQQLERVLTQVPAMYRAALLLRTCEGLAFEEIGTQLGISKKTAKTYVSRAIACCRMADWNR